MLRQEEVRASGLEWTVVESIPVHEAVKRGRPSDKVSLRSIERNHVQTHHVITHMSLNVI